MERHGGSVPCFSDVGLSAAPLPLFPADSAMSSTVQFPQRCEIRMKYVRTVNGAYSNLNSLQSVALTISVTD